MDICHEWGGTEIDVANKLMAHLNKSLLATKN